MIRRSSRLAKWLSRTLIIRPCKSMPLCHLGIRYRWVLTPDIWHVRCNKSGIRHGTEIWSNDRLPCGECGRRYSLCSALLLYDQSRPLRFIRSLLSLVLCRQSISQCSAIVASSTSDVGSSTSRLLGILTRPDGRHILWCRGSCHGGGRRFRW